MNLNLSEFLKSLFYVVIIPVLGVLTPFLVTWIHAKSDQIKELIKDNKVQKYLGYLEETISKCVVATNQTYVNTLKKLDAFGAEAQKEAFAKTYQAVMAVLTDDAKIYIKEAVGDLETYVSNQIEAAVSFQKEG